MGQLIAKKEANYTASQLTPQNNLYTTRWELKSMKKLIIEKKVAPFQKGSIDQQDEMDECPICFYVLLYHSKLLSFVYSSHTDSITQGV